MNPVTPPAWAVEADRAEVHPIRPPEGMEETVGTIRASIGPYVGDDRLSVIRLYFKLTEAEREALVNAKFDPDKRHVIELTILGNALPPVSLGVLPVEDPGPDVSENGDAR